jgi:hypothetical protein
MGDMETATSGFLAKYDGKCLECGLAIHPGKDTIVSIPGTKNCYRHTDCRTAHIHAEVDRFIGMGWDFAKFDAMIVNELRVGRMSYQDSVYYVQRFQALTEGAVV